MTKNEALVLIDSHKNKLINPVEMLSWTWLRVIISKIDDDTWKKALGEAADTICK